MTTTCSFCKDYEDTLRQNLKEIRICQNEGIRRRFKYKVRLIEYPERYIYSWQSDGEFGHKPVRFYYCPVCGKRLKDGSE